MSDTATTPEPRARRFNWLVIALVASLAVNLLFVGAGIARFYVGHGPERIAHSSQMQLIPRRFFTELERPRRVELLAVFKGYDKQFRDGRRAAREQVRELADALDAEPFDPTRVKAAVDGFATRSESLLTAGGDAALTLIGKLDDSERKMLAKHLRLRGKSERPGGEASGRP